MRLDRDQQCETALFLRRSLLEEASGSGNKRRLSLGEGRDLRVSVLVGGARASGSKFVGRSTWSAPEDREGRPGSVCRALDPHTWRIRWEPDSTAFEERCCAGSRSHLWSLGGEIARRTESPRPRSPARHPPSPSQHRMRGRANDDLSSLALPNFDLQPLCSAVHSFNNKRTRQRTHRHTHTHTQGLVGRPGGTTNWLAAERSRKGRWPTRRGRGAHARGDRPLRRTAPRRPARAARATRPRADVSEPVLDMDDRREGPGSLF